MSIIFSACYSNSYIGGDDFDDNDSTIYAYINDECFLKVKEDSCNVAGILDDDLAINKKCRVINDFIELGPKRIYGKSMYKVAVNIYTKDTLYTCITGYKTVKFDKGGKRIYQWSPKNIGNVKEY